MKNLLLSLAALLLCPAMLAQNVPPCTLALETQEDFNLWTVVNTNEGATWEWSAEEAAAGIDASEVSDDWIISSPITLEAGRLYYITAYVKTTAMYNWHDFSICLGTANTVDALTEEVYSEEDFGVNNYYEEKECEFTPPVTGNYHIGIHDYSNGRYNDYLYLQKIEITEAPVYPAQVADLRVTAGDNGAMEARLDWTWPAENHVGGALAELSGGKVYRDGELIATVDNAVPGQAGTYTDNALTEPGTYTYRVVAYNASGDAQGSAQSVESPWIGEDVPTAVTGLQATASGNEVSLQFTPPATSQHEGWVDYVALRYRITRNPGNTVLEEAYNGTLPYTDRVDVLDAYSYTVTPLNTRDEAGESATSNEVIAGNALKVPYIEPLDTEEGTKLYTIIDGNKDGRTWQFSDYSHNMNYWGGDEADEWLITPKLQLEAGKAYKVAFDASLERATSESNYKSIEVTIGQAATAEAQSPVQDFLVQSALTETMEAVFSVPESGEWHIGFHCHGQTDINSVIIGQVEVDETVFVPAAVGGLTATPGAEGALFVDLAWTNPSLTTAGTPLALLDSVEVYRGDTLIQTLKAPVMGEAATDTDTGITAAGFYDYTVTTYAAGQSSKVSVETAWVGEDVPTAVTNLQATAEGDRVTLTFDAPTGTMHDGWIDPAAIRYRITRNPGDAVAAEAYEYTAPFIETVASLGVYTYTVTPLNSRGEAGESVSSGEVTAGNAIVPPYYEPLDEETDLALFTLLDHNADGNGWSWGFLDDALAYSSGTEADDYVFTPPLDLVAGRTYRFSFDTWLYRAMESDYKTLEMTLGTDTLAERHTPFFSDVVDAAMAETFSAEFTVPESGIWYLGIHCTGVINGWQEVYVNNLAVEVVSDGGDPTALHAPASDGLRTWSYEGTLTIEAPTAQTARLYTIDGRLLHTLHLSAGLNSVDDLPRGVYLLEQQKVIIK